MKRMDLTGQRFGRLVVIKSAPNMGVENAYHCRCDCGSLKVFRRSNIKSGHTKSCGCLGKETHFKHGACRTRTYNSWMSAKRRCDYPEATGYRNYGGRGITMCDRWYNSYQAFLSDMGERPKEHSIDRIDPNGNYEPDNCRWASRKTQNNNTSRSHILEFQGRKQTISQWAKEYGLVPNSLSKRLQLGWTVERALTQPLRRSR